MRKIKYCHITKKLKKKKLQPEMIKLEIKNKNLLLYILYC